MLRRAVPTAVAGLLVLWSCTPVVVPEQSSEGTGGSRPADAENADRAGDPVAGTARKHACAAAQYGSIIGQPIDEIDIASLPEPLRVYAVGSPVTMDYWPERMNVVVGADGRVVIVKCG